MRAYHARNPEAQRARVARRKKELRDAGNALVKAAKSKPCADCKQTYPPHVMDLDHLGDDKEFNVGEWTHGWTVSLARLAAEIAKCEAICANCHRERTYRRTNGIALL